MHLQDALEQAKFKEAPSGNPQDPKDLLPISSARYHRPCPECPDGSVLFWWHTEDLQCCRVFAYLVWNTVKAPGVGWQTTNVKRVPPDLMMAELHKKDLTVLASLITVHLVDEWSKSEELIMEVSEPTLCWQDRSVNKKYLGHLPQCIPLKH